MGGGLALIGRDRELSALESAIGLQRPAFLILAGETGVGRSSLLRAVRAMARSNGWCLVPQSEEALEVGEGFSPAALEHALARPVAGTNYGDEQKLVPQMPNAEDSRAAKVPAAVESLLAGTALEPAGQQFTTIPDVLATLRRVAPVLLCLDVQTSDPDDLSWWSGLFWPAVAVSGVQVVMVAMTDLDNADGALGEAADQIIRLGPLDVEAVRARLAELADHLPVDELDHYANEISKDPALLGSFSRLLPLATPSSSSERGESGATND
jgi:AAA ATPase domain